MENTLQKLYVDDVYIGHVKRYFQDRFHLTWVFVLDTTGTKDESYSIQVSIPFANIHLFTSSPDLRIHTKETAND